MNTKPRTLSLLAFLALSLQALASATAQDSTGESVSTPRVSTGLDVLLQDRLQSITGKRIAIVTNHTGQNASGQRIADLLAKHATVVAILGPEHGFTGSAPNGVNVANGKDPATGSPVFSLYGEFHSPTSAMLKGANLVVYDIQDVGAKFYTFISTLFLTLEACARDQIPVLVLDRPNPITGVAVEGPVTHPGATSFVGIAPICIRHGMTVGELALMFNTEHFIGHKIGAQVQVVPVKGWSRSLWYDETGLPWVSPSPNMATLHTAIVYPGTCLFEGTNISEGRGTPQPFETIGAPWIDGERWADDLNAQGLPGVVFSATSFVPVGIQDKAPNPKYKDELCGGVRITVTDRELFQPVATGVAMLCSAKRLFPESLQLRTFLDRLWGSERLRERVLAQADWHQIMNETQSDKEQFLSIRSNYLVYR
jgi:uncharacterized protein YbbC (DUF1343 family)